MTTGRICEEPFQIVLGINRLRSWYPCIYCLHFTFIAGDVGCASVDNDTIVTQLNRIFSK